MDLLLLAQQALDATGTGLIGVGSGAAATVVLFRLYDRQRAAELERVLADKRELLEERKRYLEDREKSMFVVKTLADTLVAQQERIDSLERAVTDLREQFTVQSVPRRLKRLRHDPWADYERTRQAITPAMLKALK